MKVLCACIALAGLFLVGCSESKPDLKEGKWQITAQVEMVGIPFKMPPMVYEECLTQNDVIPQKDAEESGCVLEGPDVDGNTVSWVSACTNDDGSVAKSVGSITYAGETFAGQLSIEISGDQPMTANNILTGKYIGSCDEK